jgi:hypothetical protein
MSGSIGPSISFRLKKGLGLQAKSKSMSKDI